MVTINHEPCGAVFNGATGTVVDIVNNREICPHTHTSSEGHIPKYIVHDMLGFRPCPPEPILLLGADVGIPWIKMNNKGVKLHAMVLLNNTTKATSFFSCQSLTTKNVETIKCPNEAMSYGHHGYSFSSTSKV